MDGSKRTNHYLYYLNLTLTGYTNDGTLTLTVGILKGKATGKLLDNFGKWMGNLVPKDKKEL